MGMGLPAGTALPIGERLFGNYELLSKLATGGMAEIFLARPVGSSKDDLLVIKRVLPHLEDEDRFVAMFRDEARLASQIQHLNVCNVFEAGEVNQRNFIAMEYMFGVALSNVLTYTARSSSPMDPRVATGILVQACEGLHSAHDLKQEDGSLLHLVHRDMTPSNIFVTAEGIVKVLDFGVAKAHGATQKTRTGTLKGKNAYMSPEQILSKELDRRSDIFSLGVVLWESLTARRLFARSSDFLTFRAITEEEVPLVSTYRPGVPEQLSKVLQKALAREPEDRYATAIEFKDAVEAVMQNYGGVASAEEIGNYIQSGFEEDLAKSTELCDMAASISAVSPMAHQALPLQAPPDYDDPTRNLPAAAATQQGTLSAVDFNSSEMPKMDSGANIVISNGSGVNGGFGQYGTGANQRPLTDATWDGDTSSPAKIGFWFLGGAALLMAGAAAAFFILGQGDQVVVAKEGAQQVVPPIQITQVPGQKDFKNQGSTQEMIFGEDVTEKKTENDKTSTEITKDGSDSKNRKNAKDGKNATVKSSKLSKRERDKLKKGVVKTKDKDKNKTADDTTKDAPSGDPGTFSINSFPYAKIYVDGKNIGVTPILFHKLSPGPHRVKAVTQDGSTKSFKINIKSNKLFNKGEITFH